MASLVPRIGTQLGRVRELAEIGSLFERGRVVTVAGPPGIGKSTLARMFGDARRSLGERVLALDLGAAGAEGSVDAFAAAFEAQASAQLDVGGGLAALAEAYPNAPFDWLVLDEAETHAEVAAALVAGVVRGWPSLGVLVCSRVPLAGFEGTVVPLDGLDVDSSVRLLSEIATAAGSPLEHCDPASLRELALLLEHWPARLFAVGARLELTPAQTLIRELADGKGPRQRSEPWLSSELSRALEQLPLDAARALARLAAFVDSFSLELGSEVIERPLDETQHLIRALRARGWLREVPRADAGVERRFAHFRSLDEMIGGRAELEAERRRGRDLHALAYERKLIDWAREADGAQGEAAMRRITTESRELCAAFEHLRRLDGAAALGFGARLADVLRSLGAARQRQTILRGLEGLVLEEREPESAEGKPSTGLSLALDAIALGAIDRGLADEAISWISRWGPMGTPAERKGVPLHLLIRLAHAHWTRGSLEGNIGLLDECDARARRTGDESSLIDVEFIWGGVHITRMALDEAAAATRASAKRAERLGDPFRTARGLHARVNVELYRGNFDVLPSLIEAAEAPFIASGRCRARGAHGLYCTALVHAATGRTREAAALLERVVALRIAAGFEDNHASYFYKLVQLGALGSDWAAAEMWSARMTEALGGASTPIARMFRVTASFVRSMRSPRTFDERVLEEHEVALEKDAESAARLTIEETRLWLAGAWASSALKARSREDARPFALRAVGLRSKVDLPPFRPGGLTTPGREMVAAIVDPLIEDASRHARLEGGRARPALKVEPKAGRFELPDGRVVELAGKGVLLRVLDLLIEAHAAEPGRALTTEEIFRGVWPEERARLESIQDRVYAALTRLRRSGFDQVVERAANGYRLVPECEVLKAARA